MSETLRCHRKRQLIFALIANLKWLNGRAMRSLRWMSIAAVDDTHVLMDEDHEMVFEFSTDAPMNTVNVDVVDDVIVDGTDG